MRSATTAAAVRREALEPAMDAVAKSTRARQLLGDFINLAREINGLLNEVDADARRALGFLDATHAQLDALERVHGDPSEQPNARRIATQTINPAIDTLNDRTRTVEHGSAREHLHHLFAAHGEELFEPRYTHHIGAKRGLALRHEYDVWLSQTKRRAAA
jgi:hypothetical protein